MVSIHFGRILLPARSLPHAPLALPSAKRWVSRQRFYSRRLRFFRQSFHFPAINVTQRHSCGVGGVRRRAVHVADRRRRLPGQRLLGAVLSWRPSQRVQTGSRHAPRHLRSSPLAPIREHARGGTDFNRRFHLYRGRHRHRRQQPRYRRLYQVRDTSDIALPVATEMAKTITVTTTTTTSRNEISCEWKKRNNPSCHWVR